MRKKFKKNQRFIIFWWVIIKIRVGRGIVRATRLGLDPKIYYLTNLRDSEPVRDIASNSRM